MSKKTKEKNTVSFNIIDSDDPVFCSRMSPMSSEELQILAEMRNLKDRAREIKSQLTEILPDWKQRVNRSPADDIPDEAKTCLNHLDELRIKWKEREEAYQEARHRRMIALGHEDP